MDGHDATDTHDINAIDPPEIRVPHNFWIKFPPKFQTWIAQVLDGDDNDGVHQIQNLFDRINEFCNKICSSKHILPVRIRDDQWLRSEIILENPLELVNQVRPPGVLAGDMPLGGLFDGQSLENSPSELHGESMVMADISMTTLSNILPRQASLKKLLTNVAESNCEKLLGMPWRLLSNIAGRVLDAIEDGDHSGELSEGLKKVKKYFKADVKLPVIPLPAESWSFVRDIAEGSTGKVCKVIISQSVFAMKKFEEWEFLCAEKDIVEVLSHPHIVHTFGSTGSKDDASSDQYSLLMECMEDDLSGWITSKPQFEPLDSLDVLLQVAQAMEYLHREQVVHGDLKSPNILISQFDISRDPGQFIVAKVADFGSAQKANSNRFIPSMGTTQWASPEVLRCRGSTDKYLEDPFKADVYSFGLIAYEVITTRVIFEGLPRGELKKRLINHDESLSEYFTKFDDEKTNYPEPFIPFMKRCRSFLPTERPSFPEIIEIIKVTKSSMITRSSGTDWMSTTTKVQPHPTQQIKSPIESFSKSIQGTTNKAGWKEKTFQKWVQGLKKGAQTLSKAILTGISTPKVKNQLLEEELEKIEASMIHGSSETPVYSGKGLKEPKLTAVLDTMEDNARPKSKAEQIQPPPMEQNTSSEAPAEIPAPKDKAKKQKLEDDSCKGGSEESKGKNTKKRNFLQPLKDSFTKNHGASKDKAKKRNFEDDTYNGGSGESRGKNTKKRKLQLH